MMRTPFMKLSNLVICNLAISGRPNRGGSQAASPQIINLETTQSPTPHDSPSRRSAHVLDAIHQLLLNRAERACISLGVLGWSAEPARAERLCHAVRPGAAACDWR